MLIAPLAVLPLGVAVSVVVLGGRTLELPTAITGLLAVGVLAIGSRCLHVDGLSDTVDGLTASYDAPRSLQVMASGSAGPAGVVALFVVLGVQAAALAALATEPFGAALAGLAVVGSRASLAICCCRGIPPARPGGLGAYCAQSVPRAAAVVTWLFMAALLTLAAAWADMPAWRGTLAAAVGIAAVLTLLRRTYRRLGGVTGDVLGAAVELCLAALLVALV